MENPFRPFLSMPVQFVLVMGGMMLLVAMVTGYGTNNPSVFGHSSDEIEFAFVAYENDCSSQVMGFCQATCQNGETAVSGSCETSRGWGHIAIGALDGSRYECSDASFVPGEVLIARVVCLG